MLPKNVAVISPPNFDVRPPFFIAPNEFYDFIKSGGCSEDFYKIEAKRYGVVVRETGDKMLSYDIDGHVTNALDVGKGLYAKNGLAKGTRLPLWGGMGYDAEFTEQQLYSPKQDRCIAMRLCVGGQLRAARMLIHRGCVAGYINDATEPYVPSMANCRFVEGDDKSSGSRCGELGYMSVELTKDIPRGTQLLVMYGNTFWRCF